MIQTLNARDAKNKGDGERDGGTVEGSLGGWAGCGERRRGMIRMGTKSRGSRRQAEDWRFVATGRRKLV